MGFYDRDYSRNRPTSMAFSGGWNSPRGWSITMWLIVINVAVFLLNELLRGVPAVLGYFSIQLAFLQLQVWRLITYQFLHAGLFHILFNMIALYFFGRMLEARLGRWHFLCFYLTCGIAGAVAMTGLALFGILGAGIGTPLVGASAGVLGVLVGMAYLAPETRSTIMIFPFMVPMKLRTLALLVLGIAVLTILTGGRNAGGEAAHLGGALLGFLYASQPRWLAVFDTFDPARWRTGRWHTSTPTKGRSRWNPQEQRELNQELDRILDKVHAQGMNSLTEKERQTLKAASRQAREGKTL